ncbi:MAG: C1 family peptidase [Bacteroidales bacterium]|jgi:bleomycin hydrolase|nr:C1 family peptidase [Bacteroidales bacterium]
MKTFVKYLLPAGCLLAGTTTPAQDTSMFTVIREVKTTPVKDQHLSGTCWSYSALSYLESELLRRGEPEYDLSEMWIVRHTHPAKAEKYLRMFGALRFGDGGSFEDAFWVIRNFGIVPQEVYQGLNYGTEKNVHAELNAVTKAYAEALLHQHSGKHFLTTAWKKGFEGIMDAYLGERPTTFTYKGKEYTPESFAQSLNFRFDEYIALTSFSHHPFYQPFILEIPDNWIWGAYYNLPLEELQETVKYALNSGHSALWAADVSESGFSSFKGIAEISKTDAGKAITQERRQAAFDNFETTDDHGMHIVGIAHDKNGDTFYKVKNSWGDDNIYKGYLYVSEAFFLYKTIDIVVHKDAIPKHIAKKIFK